MRILVDVKLAVYFQDKTEKIYALLREAAMMVNVKFAKGLFNNYVTCRGWVGLSVFRDVAWQKTRGWVALHERPQSHGKRNYKAFFLLFWRDRDFINTDNQRYSRCFTHFSTNRAVWLLLTFFIYLHNQLSFNVKTNRLANTKWTYRNERSFSSNYCFYFSLRTSNK